MAKIAIVSEKSPAAATWLRSPQRVWLRRAIFQIHLWLGIILALYCIVIGLSGAALVFKEEMEHVAAPELFRLSSGPPHVTLQEIVQRIEADRPGWRVSGLRHFDQSAGAAAEQRGAEQYHVPVVALLARKGSPSTANYRSVSFDPKNGKVLRDGMRFDGVLGWLCNLHFYLLMGKPGKLLSGGMACGLLVLCASGVVVWWPGVQRLAGALIFRIHHRRYGSGINLKRFNWDLHAVLGFWCCAALVAVTFTGIYFCFPRPIQKIMVLATGGSLQQANAEWAPRDRQSVPSQRPVMTIDEAIAAGRKALPPNAPGGYLALPFKPGAPYSITGYYRDALPYSQLVSVSLDPKTGEVLGYSDTRQSMLGLRAVQYFFTVHFGSFGGDGWLGIVVKLLWVIVGISPAILAVTGILMYWNRKFAARWKAYRNAGM